MNIEHVNIRRARSVRTLRDARELVGAQLAPALFRLVEHARTQQGELAGLRVAIDRRAGVLFASYCGSEWVVVP